MEVTFTTKTAYTLQDIKRMIKEEGVGYDPNFTSNAILKEIDGRPVWETAWSRFEYTLEQGDLDDPLHPGRQRWCYTGAENGFLAQNLLPPMTEPEVLLVEGTYGKFMGENALELYSRRKGNWREIWRAVVMALQTQGPWNSSAWGPAPESHTLREMPLPHVNWDLGGAFADLMWGEFAYPTSEDAAAPARLGLDREEFDPIEMLETVQRRLGDVIAERRQQRDRKAR